MIGTILVHLKEDRMILICCVLIYSSVITCFSLFFIASNISDRFFYQEKFEGYFYGSVDGTGDSDDFLGVLLSNL